MFARPRPKKSVLPPLSKKRKTTHAIEEISFDGDARADYLTGFHKRKLQRIAHAQEEAAKKAREEKLELRKQVREDRKREVEEHVQQVEAILKEAERAGGVSDSDSTEEDEEWVGIPDAPPLDSVDHEEEYIDEDKYTSVTVESVSVSRDGLVKPDQERSEDDNEGEEEEDGAKEASAAQQARNQKPTHPKKKKQKFRYETKYERQLNQRKQKAKRIKSRA